MQMAILNISGCDDGGGAEKKYRNLLGDDLIKIIVHLISDSLKQSVVVEQSRRYDGQ